MLKIGGCNVFASTKIYFATLHSCHFWARINTTYFQFC